MQYRNSWTAVLTVKFDILTVTHDTDTDGERDLSQNFMSISPQSSARNSTIISTNKQLYRVIINLQ